MNGQSGLANVPSQGKYSEKKGNRYNKTRIPYWTCKGTESFQIIRNIGTILLKLSDVEVNPGPVQNPCSVCSKAVARNHRYLDCSVCAKSCHIGVKCGRVADKDYERLKSMTTYLWACPICKSQKEYINSTANLSFYCCDILPYYFQGYWNWVQLLSPHLSQGILMNAYTKNHGQVIGKEGNGPLLWRRITDLLIKIIGQLQLPVVDKIFEKLIAEQTELGIKPYLSDSITAYRKGNSTETTLLTLVENWKDEVDQKQIVGVLSTDMSKAFDYLYPPLLLKKMEIYGFSKNTIFWESQKQSENWWNVKSMDGIKQGVSSRIFIRPIIMAKWSMLYTLSCNLSMFANDHQLQIAKETPTDVLNAINNNMVDVCKWYGDNFLHANPDKYQVLTLSEKWHRSKGWWSWYRTVNITLTLRSYNIWPAIIQWTHQ